MNSKQKRNQKKTDLNPEITLNKTYHKDKNNGETI